MATRRSTRVTQVSPWIAGGEGQLRDLFPLPPWLFLLGRLLQTAFRHYFITSIILLSIYIYFHYNLSPLLAFIVFPIVIYLIRCLLVTLWLWYKNPTIPLIARKQ